MADDNTELMELLDKLKKMEPAGSRSGASSESAPKKDDVEAKVEIKLAASKVSKKTSVNDIYKKIVEIEQDIIEKEEDIKLDLKKLEELVELVGRREAELAARERDVEGKDQELTRQLEDLRRIKKELQTLLKS
jgi:hypothetical protein